MDKNTLGLDSLNQTGELKEIPWDTPATGELKEVPWGQPSIQPGQPGTRQRLRPVDAQTLRNLAAQEGAEYLAPVIEAIYGQESGSGVNARTSIDGAQGGMQVIPATFQRYAKPGERIDNPDDNMRVGVRIIKDLATKFGNDPAKIAAGYFSGEGNVNPGQGSAWKRDARDGNGKSVSGYVSDVVKRIGGKTEKQPELPDLDKAPTWAQVTQNPEFAGLTDAEKAETKAAYFDYWVAPHAGSERDKMRAQFLSQKDAVAPNAGANVLTDAGNLLGIGVNSTTQNFRELVGRIPVVGESIVKGVDAADKYLTGRSSEEILKGNVKDAQARLSPEMQAAGEKKWWDSENGTFGDAWKDPRAYASGVLQSLPEQVVTMFPAMRLAKGIYASKIAAGVAPEVASNAAARAAAIAGGASEGAFAGAASSIEVRDKIMAMKPEQLQGSEAMKALMSQGMSFEQARAQIANDSATQAFITSGLVTGAFGGMGDRVLAKAITEGVGKSFLGRVSKGAVGEGLLEEFPQEYGSAVAENLALQKADPTIGTTDDALNRGLGGAATGGLQGGGMAGVFGHNAPAQAPANPVVTPDGRIEPTVAPAPHPTVQSADAIVRELAQQAGVPESTVLPTPAPTTAPAEATAQEATTDQDVLDFADVRLEQLRAKRDGTRETVATEQGVVDQDVPGVGLSPAEAQELATLEQAQGNPQALRTLYGFDQSSAQTFPVEPQPAIEATPIQETQNAEEQTQATGPAPSPDSGSAVGQSSGAAPVQEPAAQAGGAQAADNGGQRQPRVSTQAPLTTPDLSGWTDDALRQQLRNSQDKKVRKAIGAELERRKAAAPVEEVPAAPKTEKEANQTKDYAGKWFGTAEKAQDFIAKKRIGDTHEAVQAGPSRFEIKRKEQQENGTQAAETQQAEAQGSEAPAAGAVGAEINPDTDENAPQWAGQYDVVTKGAAPEGYRQIGVNSDGNTVFESNGKRAVTVGDYLVTEKDGKPESARYAEFKTAEEIEALKKPKPKTEKEAKAQREEAKYTPVGTNQDGKTLVEDKRGVRSYVEDGIRIQEPVSLRPTAEGMGVSVENRRDEFKTVEEVGAKQTTKPDDLNALFDEVLAEELAKDEAAKPKTEKAAREQKQAAQEPNLAAAKALIEEAKVATGNAKAEAEVRRKARELAQITPMSDEKTVLALDMIATRLGMGDGNKKDLEFATPPKTEKEAKEHRTATESLASAAKNTAAGLNAAIDGLGKLFGDPNRLNSGLTFDEETYAKAKPLFQQAIANLKDAGSDLKEAMRIVVRMVLDKFGPQAVGNMKPYVVRFIEETAGQAQNAAEEKRNDTNRNQGEGASDQGQGGDLQPRSEQANSEGVANPAPEDVGQAEGGRDGRGSGTGSASGDVERGGSVREGGDAANRRPRNGRKRVANDGAGERAGSDQSGAVGPAPESQRANYFISDPEALVGGTPKVRFARNKKAIEAFQSITSEAREPTPDELDAMAGYIGWGSFGQELFQGTYDRPRPKDGWQAESDWLREHLGRESWNSAQASIINAHYTDPITVGAMWDMVRQLGFTGGRVLEPSMGVGNFFGLMPRDLMAKSRLAGIEMEQTTGGMAKILYPEANIQIKPYQDSKTADNFYDLVIGNWPFAKDGPADRRYMRLSPSLHDYFFLKALDQTRPGGLVVGITSAGTMDKKGTLTRAALAEKADLVAAFRLPSGAFEKYAGTAVVTDIIILKKRETPNADLRASGWLQTTEVDTPAGEKITVNEYFAKNPDKVLGRLNYGSGTTYGRPAMIVERPADLEQRLTALPATLPAGTFEPVTTKAKTVQYVTNNTTDREQAITVQGGKLFQVQGEYLAPLADVTSYKLKDSKKTAEREAQLAALVEIRKAYGALIDSERDGAEDTEAKRKALRDQFNAFVKAYGRVNDSDGLAILKRVGDPFYPSIAALEMPDGSPSAILSKPTIRAKKKLDKPTVRDALVLARNESIDLDMARVAELAGVPEEAAAKELMESGAVFQAPDGVYEISDVYLSGNVRRKLREAEAAAEQGMDMERNIKALKEVLPDDIPYFNIEAKLGATWIRPEQYAEFIAHLLGVKIPKGMVSNGIEVRWAVNRWKVKFEDRGLNARPEATTTWGHAGVRFDRLLTAAMGNVAVKVTYRDEDGNTKVDEQASAEANEKAGKIRDEFANWLWSDSVRKIEMERTFNEVMNAIALPKFDGSFLSFEGMTLQRGNSPFNLRKHQIDAIWRGLANGRSINAHEVGTGKTYTMGGLAVESRRYGLAKKPIIFAHNANSASVAREIGEMYPGAKLLYIDNLAPDRIAVTLRQIANDDWDAVIVPHSLIDRFTLKRESLMEISREQIEALEQEAIDAALEDNVKLDVSDMNDEDKMKKVRSSTAKQLVHARNAILKKIEEMSLRSSREDAISFEDMGIDMVIVDEAHEFKKPPIATRMRMRGLNTQTSAQSISLMFLTDYVKRLNSGRGVHMFTGTPITNTLTEIYNMMRYVMDDQMARDGIRDWDAWFNTFADSTSDVELTASGEYEPVTRMASFVNVAELRRMIGQYMDIVFADDMPEFKPRETAKGKTLTSADLTDAERAELLNGRTENPIGRPYKKVVADVAEMTPEQAEILAELQRRSNTFKKASKKERREMMLAGSPNSPVIVETDAANAGLDARLFDMRAPDAPSSKVNRAAARIVSHYKEHPLATQVVFVERGFTSESVSRKKDSQTGKTLTTKKERFNLVQDLIEKLVAAGVNRNEIAVVDGGVSKEKRKLIADAMNRAEIRVVIGNTKTLGVGVNMQTNLRAMHHLDAPWMPGDLEQRNGRGHRQGNKWNTVMEYRYLTERIDGRRWQVLSVKDRFIKAFLKAKADVRVIEGDAVSMDEEGDIGSTLSEAAGDPRLLLANKLRADIERLESKERMHSYGVFDATSKAKELESEIERKAAQIKKLSGDNEAFREAIKAGISVTIGNRKFDDAEQANEALARAVTQITEARSAPYPLGEAWGFKLYASWPSRFSEVRYYLSSGDVDYGMGKATVESARQTLYGIKDRIAKTEAEIADAKESIPRLQESAKAPFARAADLAKKRTMLADLETDIQANPIPAPAWLRSGAPVNTEVFVGGKPVVVEGHRWTKDGYLVTVSEEGKPARDVDYQEVKDDNGLPMYEARPFAAPVVQEATSTHQDKARELFAIKSALTKVESPEQIFGKVEEGRLKRGEKRDSGERKSVSTEMPKFKEDLGSPSWLQEQIDYAKERGRNRWGVPYMGKITGSFKGNISVPMSILEKLPGQRGEQQAVREKSLEYIRRNWDEVSKEPPYIEVAYNGEAWVSEGNHRIIVAKEKGLDSLPVEIRYFDGGQKVDGPLSPEKLLGAGEFSPERASILNDLATAPAAAFSSTPEEVRANALARLKSLERKREAGKITEAEYRLGVQQLIGKLEQRNDAREERRMESGRRRGADWIVSQLRRGVADQAIPRNEADFAEWLLSQNPNLANDLGISMSAKDGNGTRGNYNPLARIIKLFTSANLGEGTAVHEILHHTERMMPGDVQAGVLKAWQKARDAAYKGADDKTKAALDDMLAASLGDVKAHQRTLQAFDKGALNYDQHYQLYSPSEFWAVNASRILSGRFEAKGAWVQRAIQWFKEFVQRVKGMLGLKSDAPILKALDAVMRGEGVFQPKAQMLAERVAEPSASGEIQYNDIVRKTQNNLVQFFGNQKDSVKTFNWFNKRLSTQFHKALKDRDFGRVFGFANAMQNHVSIAAIRPAELAPGVLPRVDDVKSALKTVWKGKQASADLDGAAKAVFAGTLNGANVMQGKVFSDDELRSQFKLTDTGVALYKQARAAIDASLDELAASEAFAMAQGFVPKAMRRPLIDNPQAAPGLLDAELRKQIKMLKAAIKTAAAANNEEQRAQLEASLEAYTNTARTVEKIFVTAKNLKAAGYAPLMRFGKYTVTVQAIDPATGNLLRDENGESVTEFYGQYETEGEMKAARDQKAAEYKDRDDVRLTTGIKSQNAHELYAGISPETLALFSDAIGAGDTMKKYYQLALSERSALKRRLERKGTAGFSEDMPRVLSNFITSNARFASQRYYMRDLNNAIKFIPKEKGDVLDEAIALKKFMDNPNDAGAAVSSAMFAWFLGGSVASATINLTQPIMMTAPYLSQHGVGRATAAMAKAMPYALGKKQITDADLRAALKRASQEGVVDAQEIFHLYGLGAQSVASGLTNALAKVPGVGGKIKAGGESARARVNAFLTLWGSMFSLAEGFNRKLTFIAAWEVAKAKGEKDPFAFAVRAVNETQGIYNKVNRPNWARGPVGRTVLTFKQFGIMYIELLSRMWKRGGPEGKRAALMMLAVLMLAAGEEGLPFAQDLDDLIDTIGQGFGLDTNMRRNKRRLAHEILGKTMGDLSMYGISSQLPLDFSGRMGMGNLIPASGIAKPSDKNMMGRNVAELFGPAAGMASQIGDAYEAFTEGNKQKALANLAPKAVKDVLSGLEMADKGYATDAVGRKTTDVTAGEAAIKAVGFNPTKVAELTRKTMPIQQDVALQRITESAILDQWVRGITDNDSDMVEKAQAKLEEWNRANPDTPIQINAGQIRSRIRNQGTDKETRILKSTPKEMRGRAAEGLDMVE